MERHLTFFRVWSGSPGSTISMFEVVKQATKKFTRWLGSRLVSTMKSERDKKKINIFGQTPEEE